MWPRACVTYNHTTSKSNKNEESIKIKNFDFRETNRLELVCCLPRLTMVLLQSLPCYFSQTVEKLMDLLGTLDRWINETPPVDQPSRFGNKAYRTWFAKLDQVGTLTHVLTHIHAHGLWLAVNLFVCFVCRKQRHWCRWSSLLINVQQLQRLLSI